MAKHWVDDFEMREEFEKIEEFKDWELELVDEKGPVIIEHEDGTIVRVVRSTNTGTIAISYEPSENVKKAMLTQSDRHVSYGISQDGLEASLEWAKNYIEQHEKKNNY